MLIESVSKALKAKLQTFQCVLEKSNSYIIGNRLMHLNMKRTNECLRRCILVKVQSSDRESGLDVLKKKLCLLEWTCSLQCKVMYLKIFQDRLPKFWFGFDKYPVLLFRVFRHIKTKIISQKRSEDVENRDEDNKPKTF